MPGRLHSSGYLFNHKALTKVFRAKLLDAIRHEGLVPPVRYPATWVVDVKSVGTGDKALVYLGRHLYKGVIQEQHIIACANGQVTFRYRDARPRGPNIEPSPAPAFCGGSFSTCCPKASDAPATSASYIPTASA